MVLGNLIGGFITILVGVNLVPIIADSVFGAQNFNATGGIDNVDVTGSASTLLGLTTLFFALAIMASAIGVAALALRQAGLIEG